MKIKYNTRHKKVAKEINWHKKFIIFPRRVSQNEFQFCTTVARKLSSEYTDPTSYNWFFLAEYEYKDIQEIITNKLMGKEQ